MSFVSRGALAVVVASVCGLAATPACSSTSTHDSTGCAEAGKECVSCCEDNIGGLAKAAFVDMAQRCACQNAPLVCETECTDVCGGASVVSYDCVGCFRGAGSNCLKYQCYSNDCKDFRACLDTCK